MYIANDTPFYAIKFPDNSSRIVNTWEECKSLTVKVRGVKFKKFFTHDDALTYLDSLKGDGTNVFAVQYSALDDAQNSETSKNKNIRSLGMRKRVNMFISGAHSENGLGGWACIIKRDDSEDVELHGKYNDVTINQMELMAFISGMNYIKSLNILNHEIIINTTSSYLVQGATDWMKKWEKNFWKKSDGCIIANLSLWKKVFDFTRKFLLNFVYINDDDKKENIIRCEKLAKKECEPGKTKEIKFMDKKTSEEKENNIKEKPKISNFDMIKNLSKENFCEFICSAKFKRVVLSESYKTIIEILDAPVENGDLL